MDSEVEHIHMLKYTGNGEYLWSRDIVFTDVALLNRNTAMHDYEKQYKKQDSSERRIALSRNHAVISIENDIITITDIGSLIGTYVNDVKIGADLKTIHEDWRERGYGKNGDNIRKMNLGSRKIEFGDEIELGQEMFEGKHKYTLIDVPELHPVDREYGENNDIALIDSVPLPGAVALPFTNPKDPLKVMDIIDGDNSLIGAYGVVCDNDGYGKYTLLFSDGQTSTFWGNCMKFFKNPGIG
jgi:hypothetical protein